MLQPFYSSALSDVKSRRLSDYGILAFESQQRKRGLRPLLSFRL